MKPFAGCGELLSRRHTQSGLGESHERSLMLIVFLCTAVVFPIFAVVQVFNNHPYMALGELAVSVASLYSAHRIRRARNLLPWILCYLIPAFCFFVYIVVKPQASPTAFVWVYILPIMAYLLLGRVLGFILSAPFIAGTAIYMSVQMAPLDKAQDWVALLNLVLCAIVLLFFVHLYESLRADYQARLATLAETDSLTGLTNRSTFRSALKRTLSEASRDGTRFALVLMDIDHFKHVNDHYGHDAGDQALKLVSACLAKRLRSTDSIGRLGGEEFGLILRDIDPAGAYALIEELREHIARCELVYEQYKLRLTATFGISHWPQDAQDTPDINTLYRVADRRLYAGKATGRNLTVPDDTKSSSAPSRQDISIETCGDMGQR